MQELPFQRNSTSGCISCSLQSIREEWSPQAASVLMHAHTQEGCLLAWPKEMPKLADSQVGGFTLFHPEVLLGSGWLGRALQKVSPRAVPGDWLHQHQNHTWTNHSETNGTVESPSSRTHWAYHMLSPHCFVVVLINVGSLFTYLSVCSFIYSMEVLGFEPRTLYTLNICSTTELYPPPQSSRCF